jgi:hypothetical protein
MRFKLRLCSSQINNITGTPLKRLPAGKAFAIATSNNLIGTRAMVNLFSRNMKASHVKKTMGRNTIRSKPKATTEKPCSFARG